jgi:hypothetical protein
VLQWAKQVDPGFEPNRQFKWDMLNVLVGICWQMSMVIMPIFFVFGYFSYGFMAMGVWLTCMVILKFTWYNRLKITAA